MIRLPALIVCLVASIVGTIVTIIKNWPVWTVAVMALFVGVFLMCIVVDLVLGNVYTRH